MNFKKSKQTFFFAAVIILGFVAVFYLSGFLEKNRTALPAGYEDEDLALQGAKLKGYALGFEGLIADWYWMKSLQYIGGKVLNSKKDLSLDNLKPLNPHLLYPYLDNATTLDPKFMSVYEYGAVVLPAIDQEQAIKLTRKGIANNPNSWRLYHYLGFIYWRLGDYENAAEIYQQGSQIAGAASFMKSMAAKMESEGGSRATAREIYRQMFKEAQDAQAKENAALRLLEIDSLEERETIRQALQEFQTNNSRCANNWSELFSSLKTLKLADGRALRFEAVSFAPLDPTNVPYILNREAGKCDIALNLDKTKIPH